MTFQILSTCAVETSLHTQAFQKQDRFKNQIALRVKPQHTLLKPKETGKFLVVAEAGPRRRVRLGVPSTGSAATAGLGSGAPRSRAWEPAVLKQNESGVYAGLFHRHWGGFRTARRIGGGRGLHCGHAHLVAEHFTGNRGGYPADSLCYPVVWRCVRAADLAVLA